MEVRTVCFIIASAIGFISCFIGLHLAIEQREAEIAVQETLNKPSLTDWKKFYDNVKNDVNVHIVVEVKWDIQETKTEFAIYLVDGDEWYNLGWAVGRGCGEWDGTGRFAESCRELNRNLKHQPSDSAKIVVVGPGRPELIGVEFVYKKE